jgi:hypothetical protein
MQRNYLPSFTLLICIALFAFEAGAVDWNYGGTSKRGDYFYESERVLQGQDTINVWVRIVLSDKGKEDYRMVFHDTEGIQTIHHIMSRYEIHCAQILFRVTFSGYYDAKDALIESWGFFDIPFQDIPPGTMKDNLFKIFCNKKGKTYEFKE